MKVPAKQLKTDSPVTVGTANEKGSSDSVALSDHVHDHGVQTDGSQHALAQPDGAAGFISGEDKAKLDGVAANADVTADVLAANTNLITVGGARITGVGAPSGSSDVATKAYVDNLTFDPGRGLAQAGGSINVGANPDGSIIVNADDIQVGILATDAQHGNRGGAALHTPATTTSAGFLSAFDKSKLDNVAANADVTRTALATATTDLSVNSVKITNVADPSGAQDAATKHYVDTNGAASIVAGSGLTKSGNTLSVGANPDGSIIVNGQRVSAFG